MHNDNHEYNDTQKVKTSLLYVKIGFALCILILGAHITLWSIETIDQLINDTENTSIVKTFINLESDQKPFVIRINNDRLAIDKTDAFKFIFLLLIFIVLFNIIGRAISGIFKCLASIIVSLNINSDSSRQSSKYKRT